MKQLTSFDTKEVLKDNIPGESQLSKNLKPFTDLQLINELVHRNGIGDAPTKTIRCGEWCEVLVAAGNDETIYITFPDEALEPICKDAA